MRCILITHVYDQASILYCDRVTIHVRHLIVFLQYLCCVFWLHTFTAKQDQFTATLRLFVTRNTMNLQYAPVTA